MLQQNNSELAGLWETELSKIQSLDSVSIPDFIGNFFEKIFSKIREVFHLFDSLPSIPMARTYIIYGSLIIILLLVVFIVIKYCRRDIANFFIRVFTRKKIKKIEYDYTVFLKHGKYSEAMRFMVKTVSEIYRLGNRTFSELIFGNESISDSHVTDVYGRVLHKKEQADAVSFETAEDYASDTYPEIKKIRSRRIRSVK